MSLKLYFFDSPVKSGHLRLFINFNVALPVSLTVTAIVVSDAVLKIAAGGRVSLETT